MILIRNHDDKTAPSGIEPSRLRPKLISAQTLFLNQAVLVTITQLGYVRETAGR
jgi:hypothetical protein